MKKNKYIIKMIFAVALVSLIIASAAIAIFAVDGPYTDGTYYIYTVTYSDTDHTATITDITVDPSNLPIFGGDITLPKTIGKREHPIVAIAPNAFEDCVNITSLTLPETIESIGSRAFSKCTSLQSINIPDKVTRLPSYAFNRCTALTNITLSKNITNIGTSAFEGCTSLKELEIPAGVKNIDSWAFTSCESLEYVKFLGTTTEIDNYAFFNCSKDTVLICQKDSTAHVFAYLNGLKYQLVTFNEDGSYSQDTDPNAIPSSDKLNINQKEDDKGCTASALGTGALLSVTLLGLCTFRKKEN